MDKEKRMQALKLLKELERHLSGDDKEMDNGEDEDGSFDETEREHDSTDRDEEECSSDAEGESDEGQYDEKGLKKKMSPEHKKKMAIILLKKKMGKKEY